MMEEEAESIGTPMPSSVSMDAIFATASYTARPPVELPFQGWHRPRKQLIREQQWGREIEWLVNGKPDSDASLTYLGLPGHDLLDVRYIYDRFCRESGRELTFLGFDTAARASSPFTDALNISLDEVRRLEHVNGRSLVLGDDFRLLASPNSIAFDYAVRLGPFDVINIDLCDNAVRDAPSIGGSLYNAIYQLFGIQQRRMQPWSLFLTSRIGRDGFSPEALAKLLENVRRNLTQCEEFSNSFQGQLGLSDITPDAAADWNDRDFFMIIAVGFSKWLLGMACDMRHRFSVQSSFGYRVTSKSEYCDMLSMVLRFQPINKLSIDGTGLASAEPMFPTECSQAAKIPPRISHTRDVDQELDANPNLLDVFLDKSANLMQQARYNPVAYREWVERGRFRQ